MPGPLRTRAAVPAALLGCVAALAAAAVAGAGVAATPATKTGGALTVNLSNAELGSLDPALAYSQWAWQLTYLTNLKLLNYPDAAGTAGTQLVADGADLPTVSTDGKTYTFTVRAGQRFSSGEPVTAKSFADAIDRDLDPRNASPGAQRAFLGAVVGYDDRVAGRSTHLAGVTATGQTLVIRLAQADPALPHKLALPFFAAVPKDAGTPDPTGTRVPAAAGPYAVKSLTPGKQLVLARNAYYAGSRPRVADTVTVTLGTDRTKSLAAVKAGTADLDIGGIAPDQVASLAPLLGTQLFVDRLRFGLDYLVLNTAPGRFFADPAARKAANLAVDRRALLRARGAFPGTATGQIIPPGMTGRRDLKLYPLTGADPVGAKALWGGGGTFTLYVANAGVTPVQALVIQANFAQIGVDVTIQQFPTGVFESRIATRGEPFDAALVSWNADYPDPSALLNVLFSGRGITATGNTNLSYLDVPRVNALLDAAAAASGAARDKAYADLDTLLMGTYVPVVPLYNRNERTFVSARLDPRCYVFQPVYAALDLAAACLR